MLMLRNFNPFHATDLFDTPWKHQKTRSFFMFKGVPNEIIGMKWDKPWKFLIKRRERILIKKRERQRDTETETDRERAINFVTVLSCLWKKWYTTNLLTAFFAMPMHLIWRIVCGVSWADSIFTVAAKENS